MAPALLAFDVGFRTYLDTVVLTGFICCGLARLARFNATVALVPKDAKGKAAYFEGLPIPSSLAIVSAIFVQTIPSGRFTYPMLANTLVVAHRLSHALMSWVVHRA